jgi:hypothetical protein
MIYIILGAVIFLCIVYWYISPQPIGFISDEEADELLRKEKLNKK